MQRHLNRRSLIGIGHLIRCITADQETSVGYNDLLPLESRVSLSVDLYRTRTRISQGSEEIAQFQSFTWRQGLSLHQRYQRTAGLIEKIRQQPPLGQLPGQSQVGQCQTRQQWRVIIASLWWSGRPIGGQ